MYWDTKGAGTDCSAERVGGKNIIFAMKRYSCLLVLWFRKDDMVTKTEAPVCIQMY